MVDALTLPESFALLLIEPSGRRAVDGTTFDTGLAGAVLADLALRRAVSLAGRHVAVTDGSSTGDAVLDAALGSIAAADGGRTAKRWVAVLGKRPLRDQVVGALVSRGVLSEEQRTTLGVFTTTRFPEQDGAPEAELRRTLADVLVGAAAPSPQSAVLVGLLDATGTLRRQFDLIDRQLVKEIVAGRGDWASPAIKAVLQEIQAAALVTMTAATTASTTGIIANS